MILPLEHSSPLCGRSWRKVWNTSRSFKHDAHWRFVYSLPLSLVKVNQTHVTHPRNILPQQIKLKSKPEIIVLFLPSPWLIRVLGDPSFNRPPCLRFYHPYFHRHIKLRSPSLSFNDKSSEDFNILPFFNYSSLIHYNPVSSPTARVTFINCRYFSSTLKTTSLLFVEPQGFSPPHPSSSNFSVLLSGSSCPLWADHIYSALKISNNYNIFNNKNRR